MRPTARPRCLSDELSEYAGGRLPAARRLQWDRHLAVCDLCRAGLEREKRLVAAMVGAPSLPGDLRAALLALGADQRRPTEPSPLPTAPPGLRLVEPHAPAAYRPLARVAVVVAAAAGASALSIWTVAMVSPGAPITANTDGVTPVAISASPDVVAEVGRGASVASFLVEWSDAGQGPGGATERAESLP